MLSAVNPSWHWAPLPSAILGCQPREVLEQNGSQKEREEEKPAPEGKGENLFPTQVFVPAVPGLARLGWALLLLHVG